MLRRHTMLPMLAALGALTAHAPFRKEGDEAPPPDDKGGGAGGGETKTPPSTGKDGDTITKSRKEYDEELAARASRAEKKGRDAMLVALREAGVDVKDEAGLKEIAKKFKALEDEKKSELEKLNARATKAEKDLDDARRDAAEAKEQAEMTRLFAQGDVADYELMEYLYGKTKAAQGDDFDPAAFIEAQKKDRPQLFKTAPAEETTTEQPPGKKPAPTTAPARTGTPPPNTKPAPQQNAKFNAMDPTLTREQLRQQAIAEGIDPSLFPT